MAELAPTAVIIAVGLTLYAISPAAWLAYAVMLAVAGVVIRLLGLG